MSVERVDILPVPSLDVQTGLLLAMLDDNTKDWREELGEVSQETLLWQPFPGGHSIGVLILHIADVEANWLHEVGAGQPQSEEELSRLLSAETQQYQLSWPTPPDHPLSWYYAQHDAVRARTHELVVALDDPEHLGIKEKYQGKKEFTLRWLLHHVLTHEAYHGGQAVLLSILHGRQTKMEG